MIVAIAWLADHATALWAWSGRAGREQWARPLLLALLASVLVLPLDGPLLHAARWLDAEVVGGDLRRVLELLGEWGQGVWLVLVAIAIWKLDPPRRPRLADLALAVPLLLVAANAAKMLVGRPRPRDAMLELYGPTDVLGPLGQHPFGPEVGLRHAWEVFPPADLSNIQAMPSSHAAFACLLSVFLIRLYPALRTPAIVLAATVCFCRVLFGAHWPTDTIIGAALGVACARLTVERSLGQRAIDAARHWLGYTPLFIPRAA